MVCVWMFSSINYSREAITKQTPIGEKVIRFCLAKRDVHAGLASEKLHNLHVTSNPLHNAYSYARGTRGACRSGTHGGGADDLLRVRQRTLDRLGKSLFLLERLLPP